MTNADLAAELAALKVSAAPPSSPQVAAQPPAPAAMRPAPAAAAKSGVVLPTTAGHLPASPATTVYEFEKHWRELKGDLSLTYRYISVRNRNDRLGESSFDSLQVSTMVIV